MPAAAAKSCQSCLTLYDPIDGSPPGSAIPGILQARTQEWAAISFFSAWKWEVKVKSLSRVPLFATPWTAAHQAPPSMGFPRQEYWSGVPLPSPNPCLCGQLLYDKVGRNTHWVKDNLSHKWCWGASLVAQWEGICLPVQETRVWSLTWEDPTCHRASQPVRHNYEPALHNYCSPRHPGARAPHKRGRHRSHTQQRERRPRSQQDPVQPKIKLPIGGVEKKKDNHMQTNKLDPYLTPYRKLTQDD